MSFSRRHKFIIAIIIAGLFADHLLSRLARLEYGAADLSLRRERLARLEKKSMRIDALEEYASSLEESVQALQSLVAQLNTNDRRAQLFLDINGPAWSERGVRVFRTSPGAERVKATYISGHPGHQKRFKGVHSEFLVGSDLDGYHQRGLIKFDEVKPGAMRGKKIMAAFLYLRYLKSRDHPDDDRARGETINVYAVLKKWTAGEVYKVAGDRIAEHGEPTWLAARQGIEDWAQPGCAKPDEDFDPLILATSGPAVFGNSEGWLPLKFTKAGLEKLERWFVDPQALNEGFLLKLQYEGKPGTVVLFYTGLSGDESWVPYLEIYYEDKGDIKGPKESKR